jgi:hypothetical protein
VRNHHRPLFRGEAFFSEHAGEVDPIALNEAADRAAAVLVRGSRRSDDATVADRVLSLAEVEGIEGIAELWADRPEDSLAGALWRLYLLHEWVHADPVGAAAEFEAGRTRAQVARILAGVEEPPGPDQVRAMVDEVLRGIATREFADVLWQAAAFARVVAFGRAGLGESPDLDQGPAHGAARMLALSEALERAAHLELSGSLD